MIDNLSKSELFTRASLLIKYGFRTTIIALDTGLPIHIIRRLHKVPMHCDKTPPIYIQSMSVVPLRHYFDTDGHCTRNPRSRHATLRYDSGTGMTSDRYRSAV